MIQHGAFTPIKSLKLYDLGSNVRQPYFINDFVSLGWPEPYYKPIQKGTCSGENKFDYDQIQKYRDQCQKWNVENNRGDGIFELQAVDPKKIMAGIDMRESRGKGIGARTLQKSVT